MQEYKQTSLNTDNVVSDYYSFTDQTRDEGIQIKNKKAMSGI